MSDFIGATGSAPTIWIVVPPFTSAEYPSLYAGLAKAAFDTAGLNATVINLSQTLAALAGMDRYQAIAGLQRSIGVGDWLGASLLRANFPDRLPLSSPNLHRSFYDYLENKHSFSQEAINIVRQLEEPTVDLLSVLAIGAQWEDGDILLFCCGHQQLGFSLSLSYALKRRFSNIQTVLFGSAVGAADIAKGLLSGFEYVDTVIYADAGAVISQSAETIPFRFSGPGVLTRQLINEQLEPEHVMQRPRPAVELRPAYQDFYAQRIRDSIETVLPWRASVGCHWADKALCTFCGLVPEQTRYAAKPGREAAAELTGLVEEHETLDVVTNDLLISPEYFETFLTEIEKQNFDLTLFFEIKATTTKYQLSRLGRAGVQSVQIGIESFDEESLRGMRKGTNILINIRALKWCLELGICASWIYLCGFPDESAETYAVQAELISKLTHLQPPLTLTPIRIERGSPMYHSPRKFGLGAIRPAEAMLHTYPTSEANLRRMAIYFDHDYEDGRRPETQAKSLADAVDKWRRLWRLDLLHYRQGPGFTKISDYRGSPTVTTLSGWEACAFSFLDDVVTIDHLTNSVRKNYPCVDQEQVLALVAALTEAGLVVRARNTFISVVPRWRKWGAGLDLMQRRIHSTSSCLISEASLSPLTYSESLSD